MTDKIGQIEDIPIWELNWRTCEDQVGWYLEAGFSSDQVASFRTQAGQHISLLYLIRLLRSHLLTRQP